MVKRVATVHPFSVTGSSDVDLALIERRCRLKAEAARWAAIRRRLLSKGATFSNEIAPIDQKIIEKARALSGCFLWMCNPHVLFDGDVGLYEHVAICFEAVADALSVLKQILDDLDLHRSEFETTLHLLAEAQSALRLSILAVEGPCDSDQKLAFERLKVISWQHQIFIRR